MSQPNTWQNALSRPGRKRPAVVFWQTNEREGAFVMPTQKDNYCIDCDKNIWSDSIRCKPCSAKARRRKNESRVRTDGLVEVALTKGQAMIIGRRDWDRFKKYKWYAQWAPTAKTFYAQTMTPMKNGKRKLLRIHRLILNAPSCLHVDHINHNGLDNRRCNIRLCTPQQNTFNARPQYHRTSIYKGVSWAKGPRKWKASIRINNKMRFLGHFADELEAAHAYNKVALDAHGEFAYLNDVLAW